MRIGHGPVRTGVTATLPPSDDRYFQPVEAAQFVFNGAGTVAGLSATGGPVAEAPLAAARA